MCNPPYTVVVLQGITATYRMTTKGPPTRHSHYVTGALTPLKAALDSERVQRLPAAKTARLAAAVADIVCVRCVFPVKLPGPVQRGCCGMLPFTF